MTPDRSPTPFGELVHRLRLARGWSQAQLAQQAGVTDGYISGIESGLRGRRPSSQTLLRLAGALSCDPADLFASAGKQMSAVEADQLRAKLRQAPEVRVAIQRDPLLRAAEKDVMLRLYDSYTASRQTRQ